MKLKPQFKCSALQGSEGLSARPWWSCWRGKASLQEQSPFAVALATKTFISIFVFCSAEGAPSPPAAPSPPLGDDIDLQHLSGSTG